MTGKRTRPYDCRTKPCRFRNGMVPPKTAPKWHAVSRAARKRHGGTPTPKRPDPRSKHAQNVPKPKRHANGMLAAGVTLDGACRFSVSIGNGTPRHGGMK